MGYLGRWFGIIKGCVLVIVLFVGMGGKVFCRVAEGEKSEELFIVSWGLGGLLSLRRYI